MSGGYFNNDCYRISQFGDDLAHEIETNDDPAIDAYGDRIGKGYGPETIVRLKRAQQAIELAGKLAREVEWLYSGDHGEETLCDLIDKLYLEYGGAGPSAFGWLVRPGAS